MNHAARIAERLTTAISRLPIYAAIIAATILILAAANQRPHVTLAATHPTTTILTTRPTP